MINKLSASGAKDMAIKYNRKKYRNAVISEYKRLLRTIKWHSKRGKRCINFKCGIWDFEEYHAVRLFCYKHQDFIISWSYDDEIEDRRVDLDKHDRFSITIKW